MHKTAILNRDENINDPSSAADFYVDPAPVKSSRRLILGGLLIAATVSRYTLRSFKPMKSDSSLTSDLRHSQFSCSNNRYVVTKIVIDHEFPEHLKKSTTIPIYKEDNLDHEKFKNYRPITCVSHLSILAEKVILKQLMDHF